MDLKEKHQQVAFSMCPDWDGTPTQAYALPRNQTGGLLVCETMPGQLSYTSQGQNQSFNEVT